LTVTQVEPIGKTARFSVDVSNETRAKTTLGNLQIGEKINLERPLKAGDEFGGHVVSGHVDGVAHITDIYADGGCQRFVFEAPEHLALYIAPKGSIALDGTSLTVNEVAGCSFGVNLIPHSLDVTTWGQRRIGDSVNIEVDLFARYVARLLECRQ
ncbi:MAG: riboflavin synthase, partial [Pseudomonadota bacterium]